MSRPIRVLHIAKYDDRGGAARAAAASVRGQQAIGIDAVLYAGRVVGQGVAVNTPQPLQRLATLARYAGERLPFRMLGVPKHDVHSLGLFGTNPQHLVGSYQPDIVVLHGVDGLIAVQDLPHFDVPVFWRLHDMWPLGGASHYTAPDTPPLEGLLRLLDANTRRRQERAYHDTRALTLSSPSHWLAREAARSQVTAHLSCHVVPNGINTLRFAPLPRADARAALGLPASGLVLAFGAAGGSAEPRKGFDLLVAALRQVDSALADMGVTLILFGGGNSPELEGLATPIRNLGPLRSAKELVTAYSAADVFISPSRMENLSLMVLESMACGTPVIAFSIGGMPDMVRPGVSGWLIPPFDVDAMARQLVELANAPAAAEALRLTARELVEQTFSSEAEAKDMAVHFHRVLAKAPTEIEP